MHSRVRENVRHVLGPEAPKDEVEQVARQQWRNYLRYLRDFVSLPHAAEAELPHIFANADGWEYVEEAMSHGHGAVMVSAHFGNWDLAAATMAQRYPVNVIADRFTPERLDQLVNSYRDALGLKVIPIDRALKRTLTALRHNEAVAFLVDKPIPQDEGVEVQFFGQPTRIPGGAAFFAIKARCPVIPAFVWRDHDWVFRAKVFPPVRYEGSGDTQRDVRAVMQLVMARLEEMIRARPESWYMFRRMWSIPDQVEEAVA